MFRTAFRTSILIWTALSLSQAKAQVQLFAAHHFQCDDTTYNSNLYPCFEKLNNQWKILNKPNSTLYLSTNKKTHALRESCITKEPLEDSTWNYTINSDKINHALLTDADSTSCILPVMLSNQKLNFKRSKQLEPSYDYITGIVLHYIQQQLDVKNAISPSLTFSKVHHIFSLKNNNFLLSATLPLDLYAIEKGYNSDTNRDNSMFDQLSKQNLLAKTLFLIQNGKVTILGHELDYVCDGDFDKDGKRDFIFSQFRESYNNMMLLSDQGKLILHKALGGN